jgi:lysine 2,3-aminomutase
MRVNRRMEIFGDVPDDSWNNWKWQFKNRITTLEDLKRYLPLTKEEDDPKILETLRMAITPYYLSLIDPHDPYDPIRKQAVPTIHEFKRSPT